MAHWLRTAAMGRAVLLMALVVVVGCGRDSSPGSPVAAGEDVGYRNSTFDSLGVGPGDYGPTGIKPQSKLWFNDGSWWGILFEHAVGEYRIYSYDEKFRTWSDTGTRVDKRERSMADALWDGDKLYVVSATPDVDYGHGSARLSRYSYDAASRGYSLDEGFPLTITAGGMEAVVLAKDTAGKLWVTYTQKNEVYVAHSLSNDLTWADPFVLPVDGSNVSPDDISSVVAFDGQVGVMWSNQLDDAFYFATHKDGDPADAWRVGTALRGSGMVNDHINLKADSTGRVYASVGTRRDRVRRRPDAPQILLLARDTQGRWTDHVFGRVVDKHARSIVLLDEEHRSLYVFATSPCCDGGSVYYKSTSLDDITFAKGLGTPFIKSTTDANINDPTSTKQNLDHETGLLVAASDNVTDHYLHNFVGLNSASEDR